MSSSRPLHVIAVAVLGGLLRCGLGRFPPGPLHTRVVAGSIPAAPIPASERSDARLN